MPGVTLKPGVLFLATISGGVLMDVGADRFLSLGPLGAAAWGSLAVGAAFPEVADRIAAMRGLARDGAEALLASLLQCWEEAGLVNTRESGEELPVPQPPPLAPAGRWLSDDTDARWPAPGLLATLHLAERRYRRSLAEAGLSRTLTRFQMERGRPAARPDTTVRRALGAYHALRLGFRQGVEARDCLVRSLALGAVLKRRGVDAQLCIGVVDLPFASHAWIEAGGSVLNETPEVRGRFAVIGRF